MDIFDLHPWNITYEEAIKVQNCLSREVTLKGVDKEIKYIAGLDVSYAQGTPILWAGVVVLEFSSLVKREEQWTKREASFPYIPGLLSFREVPALLDALRKVTLEPDLIFCDGQGIAHPRGLGLAAHLGVLLRKPTIGCAKSRLVGDFDSVGQYKGDYGYLRYQGKTIGAVLRTRTGIKPLFVSPGNRIVLEDCIKYVFRTCTRYRIPEPIRQAHLLVNSVRGRL